MLQKPNEALLTQKTRSFSVKGNTRPKTIEGNINKDKTGLHTSIPQSVTLMRARSCEKNVKTDGVNKKTSETKEHVKTKSEKHKKLFNFEIEDDALDRVSKMTTKVNNCSENELENKSDSKQKKFSQLLPLCEKELKKIEDVWLSTVYCSLSTRANLVKFLLQSFPGIEKSQFQAEDRKLIQCLDQVNVSTKAESNNLINLVKTILKTQELTKEEYNNLIGHDTNRSDIGKKVVQADSKQFKADSSTAQIKKDPNDETGSDKTQKPDTNTTKKKDSHFMSFFSFGNLQNTNKTQKEGEKTSKTNDNECGELNKKAGDGQQNKEGTAQKKKAPTDAADASNKRDTASKKKDSNFMSFFTFGNQQEVIKAPNENENKPPQEKKETKTEPQKLSSVQKDYETLKNEFTYQNETYEKKIKDLETLLEEKIKILKQEKDVKKQLQTCLSQFQAHQKRLSKTIGTEQLEFLIGRSSAGRDKRREELYMTAIKLILKGFFIQLKNLEIERNKMLFQLQSNDVENFNALAASIMQKENFAKSIKQQMKSFNKAYLKRRLKENQS